jgi:hypothetical protein
MILPCNGAQCHSEFQDKKYGANKRVFNRMKAPGNYRCAVCGRQTTHGKTSEEGGKKKKGK